MREKWYADANTLYLVIFHLNACSNERLSLSQAEYAQEIMSFRSPMLALREIFHNEHSNHNIKEETSTLIYMHSSIRMFRFSLFLSVIQSQDVVDIRSSYYFSYI